MNTDLVYFCVAIAIGVLFVYLLTSNSKTIIKLPNPMNSDKLLYVDDNNVCYKYKPEEVPCPMDTTRTNIIDYNKKK